MNSKLLKLFIIVAFIIISVRSATDNVGISSNSHHQNDNNDDEVDELANRLIDGALERIRNLSDIEPYHLHRNYRLEIHQQLGLIPVDICLSSCYLIIRNGILNGLSRMQRTSNGAIVNEEGTNDLIAYFVVGIENANLESILQFTIGHMEVFSRLTSSHIGLIRIKMKIASRKKGLELLSLRVRRIQNVRIRFSTKNETTVNNDGDDDNERWLLDAMTNAIITYFNDHVRRVLSRALFEILSEEFKFMQD
ncbi:mite allergen Lep d 7-like [Dermatophagoides pteronyssinus]|uniref:mite allergen Lep d 7-like n=1 Tax=Dermatophagoides pteronyssinus TaxID=6956 RepID=UPI003F6739AA